MIVRCKKLISILFLSLFLVQCVSTSKPWQSSGNSTSAPANLLKQEQVLATEEEGTLSFARTEKETLSSDQQYPTQANVEKASIEFNKILEDIEKKEEIQTKDFISSMQETTPVGPKIQVAILLPLSGQHKDVGQAILNAAQMALFDIAGDHFELIPRDTQGTKDGARQAATSAIEENASFVLGPLFADSARTVKPLLKSADIKMLTFSTDWRLADNNTYVMGFMPFDQVRRVMGFAASQGHTQQALLAPYSPYGNAVSETFKQVSSYYKQIDPVMAERYRLGDENFNDLIRKFTSYDDRVTNLEEAIARIENIPENQRTELDANELARLQIQHTEGDLPFDSILLPIGGNEIKELTSILKYYDVDLKQARFLGTGLWDTPNIHREVSMRGAWFAAPSPKQRKSFEENYQNIYGSKPPRIASLGYDSTALIAVLSRQYALYSPKTIFSKENITNPNGFAGIDGIFRFSKRGLIERGLAVLEVTSNGLKVVSPAPTTFQEPAF